MKRCFKGEVEKNVATAVVKYTAIAIAILGVLLYIVINHSVAEEKFIICSGSYYDNDKPLQQQEIHFKFIKYRW